MCSYSLAGNGEVKFYPLFTNFDEIQSTPRSVNVLKKHSISIDGEVFFVI